MLGGLTGIHIVVIVGVIILLFGATRLPVFSKSLGQSIKIFRKEMHDVKTDVDADRKKVADDEAKPVVYTNEPPAGTTPRDSSGR